MLVVILRELGLRNAIVKIFIDVKILVLVADQRIAIFQNLTFHFGFVDVDSLHRLADEQLLVDPAVDIRLYSHGTVFLRNFVGHDTGKLILVEVQRRSPTSDGLTALAGRIIPFSCNEIARRKKNDYSEYRYDRFCRFHLFLYVSWRTAFTVSC